MSALDFTDLSACANKERKPGYWHVAPSIEAGVAVVKKTWIQDRSTTDCKYDRKHVDTACRAENCLRIGKP